MTMPVISEFHTDTADFLDELAGLAARCKVRACVVVLYCDDEHKSYQFNLEDNDDWLNALVVISNHYRLTVTEN